MSKSKGREFTHYFTDIDIKPRDAMEAALGEVIPAKWLAFKRVMRERAEVMERQSEERIKKLAKTLLSHTKKTKSAVKSRA